MIAILKSVDEIKDLQAEVYDEFAGDQDKWITSHAGIEPSALKQYVESGDFPSDPKVAALTAFQLGVGARERVEKS